jgi:hypothetical protein
MKELVSWENGASKIFPEYDLWVVVMQLDEFIIALHSTIKRCIRTLASVEHHYKFLEWHHHHPLWIDDV